MGATQSIVKQFESKIDDMYSKASEFYTGSSVPLRFSCTNLRTVTDRFGYIRLPFFVFFI